MTLDIIILAALAAGAVMCACADYKRAQRERARYRNRGLLIVMSARWKSRRALVQELHQDVARARAREMKQVGWSQATLVARPCDRGVTGVKHPDMAAFVADAEARRGREAKIEVVGRRNEA